MRTQAHEHGSTVWVSADDTHRWAHKPGANWPCSTLSGKRFVACFDARGNLVDFSVNGRSDHGFVDAYELDAILKDLIGSAHPEPRKTSIVDGCWSIIPEVLA